MNGVSSVRDMGITSRLADYVIKAGAIYSMAENRAVYGAIALHDEWIVAVSQDPNGLDGLVTASTHVARSRSGCRDRNMPSTGTPRSNSIRSAVPG